MVIIIIIIINSNIHRLFERIKWKRQSRIKERWRRYLRSSNPTQFIYSLLHSLQINSFITIMRVITSCEKLDFSFLTKRILYENEQLPAKWWSVDSQAIKDFGVSQQRLTLERKSTDFSIFRRRLIDSVARTFTESIAQHKIFPSIAQKLRIFEITSWFTRRLTIWDEEKTTKKSAMREIQCLWLDRERVTYVASYWRTCNV